MNVFFYGLFMDKAVLAEQGIAPSGAAIGYLDGYELRIGERATLLRSTGARAYGVVMNITIDEVQNLYSQSNVADYVSEPVTVELPDESKVEAVCYNLPGDKIIGTNQKYAESLLEVAISLGFPESYLDKIRDG